MKQNTLDIILKALKYYANRETWKVKQINSSTFMSPAGEDLGQKARLALSCLLTDTTKEKAAVEASNQSNFQFNALGYKIVPARAGWLIQYQKTAWGEVLFMGYSMCLADAVEASKTAFNTESLAILALTKFLEKKGIKNVKS